VHSFEVDKLTFTLMRYSPVCARLRGAVYCRSWYAKAGPRVTSGDVTCAMKDQSPGQAESGLRVTCSEL
jgi:hypothetical protein